MLEPPRQGGSNEYPQSMFWIKNKKIRYTPEFFFFIIKVEFKGVYISLCCRLIDYTSQTEYPETTNTVGTNKHR